MSTSGAARFRVPVYDTCLAAEAHRLATGAGIHGAISLIQAYRGYVELAEMRAEVMEKEGIDAESAAILDRLCREAEEMEKQVRIFVVRRRLSAVA